MHVTARKYECNSVIICSSGFSLLPPCLSYLFPQLGAITLLERSLTALITGYGPTREREVPTKETDTHTADIKAPDGYLYPNAA
jgi:hypothetical protein